MSRSRIPVLTLITPLSRGMWGTPSRRRLGSTSSGMLIFLWAVVKESPMSVTLHSVRRYVRLLDDKSGELQLKSKLLVHRLPFGLSLPPTQRHRAVGDPGGTDTLRSSFQVLSSQNSAHPPKGLYPRTRTRSPAGLALY